LKFSFSFCYIIGGVIITSLFLLRCTPSKTAELSAFGPVNSTADNSLSAEKIALGKKLFFDTRLSIDESVSCATCHLPAFGFTDRKKVSEGVENRKTDRNSPSILNAIFLPTVMFDAHITSLEMQVIVPIQEHVEMDIDMLVLIARLRKVEEYQEAAKRIYNRNFDPWVLTRSIAAFERSLVSDNSRFDQYYYKNKKHAITKQEKRGWEIFSKELYCTACHPAPFFTTYNAENNGLYLDYGKDKGRFRINQDSSDIGLFKVPSLRNIELTYPYMHDGSISNLTDVLTHYKSGGKGHRLQNKLIQPFTITKQQTEDLISFLHTLTDTSYMKDYR
jgi:cytochrome c peroxidase